MPGGLYSSKCLADEFSEPQLAPFGLVTSSLLWCRKYRCGRQKILKRGPEKERFLDESEGSPQAAFHHVSPFHNAC